MSSYIQINIYNQSLDVLKMRGLDLKTILKTLGCPDTWITEVPIPSPTQNASKPSSTNSTKMQQANTSHADSSISLTKTNASSNTAEKCRSPLKKPFKSISAEIGFIQPLDLADVLKDEYSEQTSTGSSSEIITTKRPTTGLRDLFDDWDPTANLDAPGTSSDIPNNATLISDGLKIPKEEVIEEAEEEQNTVDDTSLFDMNDSEAANEQERSIIQQLLGQQNLEKVDHDSCSMTVARSKKKNGEDSELYTNYIITCNYPGCGLQYNWRVKYGKLRLLDHALTHSDRKIPCRLCGFECTNVRRMRSHYSKVHPNERVEGYGMKALVSGEYGTDQQVSDEELKALWNACYSESLHLVGHATGFVDGDKYKRMTKRRKLERESLNSGTFLF